MSFRPLGQYAIEKTGCQPFCNVIANKSKEERCDIYEDNYYTLQLTKYRKDKLEKITNLLKEKRVDLALLSMVASYQEYKTAKRIANVYNTRRRDWAKALTEEDVTLLVEWLKENNNG